VAPNVVRHDGKPEIRETRRIAIGVEQKSIDLRAEALDRMSDQGATLERH
jgi:hypothetical protein